MLFSSEVFGSMLPMKALDRITMLFNLGDLFNNIYRIKRHFS